MNKNVLKSELAGSWYAADPVELMQELDACFDVEVEPRDGVMALLLPHAGYGYSGRTAARAVQLLAGQTFKRVVVIGPSHQVALQDVASLPDVTHVETPLGQIEVDREWVDALLKEPPFISYAAAHSGEHSVQIELPLLQRVLGEFRVVPLVCGQLNEQSAREMASVLLRLMDEQTLLVVSSDFTHFGASFGYVPFGRDIQENLRGLDLGAFKFLEKKDLSGFLAYVDARGATICGRSPISVLLAMLPDSACVELVEYATSGELTGDWSHCVSYISAAVLGAWSEGCADGEPSVYAAVLSESDKIGLLRLARNRMACTLDRDEVKFELEITPAMQSVMGVFVTLHKHGVLRGCIGEIFPQRSLVEGVAEQAINAAFCDPRFPRLTLDELADVDVEISALTPPRLVGSFSDIVVGRHGVVLYRNGHSAVFLPQVAPEQGWGRDEMLSHLAVKAGLESNDWKTGCEFHVFEAIVFGEV